MCHTCNTYVCVYMYDVYCVYNGYPKMYVCVHTCVAGLRVVNKSSCCAPAILPCAFPQLFKQPKVCTRAYTRSIYLFCSATYFFFNCFSNFFTATPVELLPLTTIDFKQHCCFVRPAMALVNTAMSPSVKPL